jgi:predicted enzyme related to lactoylglutathione lyase
MPNSQPAGAFAHVELISKDPARSLTFYETVFGWKFDDAGDGYLFTSPPSLPTGALRPPQKGEAPGTLSYIEVKDVSKTIASAEAAGARVLVPKTEIPNMGHFAVLLTPREIPQGIFQTR